MKNGITKKAVNAKDQSGRSHHTSLGSALLNTLECQNNMDLAEIINKKFCESFIQLRSMPTIFSDEGLDTIITLDKVMRGVSHIKTNKDFLKGDLHPRLYVESLHSLEPVT